MTFDVLRIISLEILADRNEFLDEDPKSMIARYILESHHDTRSGQKNEMAGACRDSSYGRTRYFRSLKSRQTPLRVSPGEGCARINQHLLRKTDKIDADEYWTFELLSYTFFSLPCIFRLSEKMMPSLSDSTSSSSSVSSPSSYQEKNNTIVNLDLTTTDEWEMVLSITEDFVCLPPVLSLAFRWGSISEKGHNYHTTVSIIFRKRIPRRYIDCCFDSGHLFCYAVDSVRFIKEFQAS